MTLQASGAISLSDVNVELHRSSTAQLGMDDSEVRAAFVKPSGAIDMASGYGKDKIYVSQGRVALTTIGTYTWTAPSTAYQLRVLVIGGGGTAGFPWCNYNNNRTPMTGGSGGYTLSQFFCNPNTTYNVKVGSAGVAPTESPQVNGGPGNPSSFSGLDKSGGSVNMFSSGGVAGYFVYGPNYGVAGPDGTGSGGTNTNSNVRYIAAHPGARFFSWEASYLSYGYGADAQTYSSQTNGVVVIEWLF